MALATVSNSVKRFGCAAMVAAVLVVSGTGARAEIPEKLKTALDSPSTKVRIVAIAGVAKSGDKNAAALLTPLLKDKEPAVRAAAVDGFATLGDPAALATLAALARDEDPTVKAVFARATQSLESRRVFVDVGELQDATKGQVPGLIEDLQKQVQASIESEMGARAVVRKGGVDKGYGLILGIRHIKPQKDGNNSLLEVRCELTLVELPGKILRVSSNATAAAGVEGDMPKSLEAELAHDGVAACAPSLAKDFVDYVRPRMQP